MQVTLWNKETHQVKDRTEAIRVVEQELRAWMESTDHIEWYHSGLDYDLGRRPSCAQVTTQYGEMTDAYAFIDQD